MSGCGGKSPEKLVASARAALERQDPKAAMIDLKAALDTTPGSAEARFLLGKAMLAAGDPVGAETELRKATERGAAEIDVVPELARAMLLLGQAGRVIAQFGSVTLGNPGAQASLKTTLAAAHAQQGDLPKADAEISAALAAVPGHAPAMIVQARMIADSGDIDRALAVLDAVLAKDPTNDQAGVAKGYLLWLGKGDADAALAAHRQVLAAKPATVAARAEIVTLLFSQGKTAEARKEFELLRKAAPNDPQTAFFDAQFAYVDKDYRRARSLTEPLLKAIPDHYRALELAAAAEYRMGNDAVAQALLGRALKVAPTLVLSRQILAQSYLRTGQPAKAIEALQPLLKGRKPDAGSFALAGAAYVQIGDIRKADDAFKKARQGAPDSARVRTIAALADLSGGRADVAVKELQAIAATDAGTTADLALYAAQIASGDFAGAMKTVGTLQSKEPGAPLPDQLRGQLLVAKRDGDGARRSFEASLAKDGRYFPAVAALASMDVAVGKRDAARARVSAFVKAVPNQSRAYLLIAEIDRAAGAPPDQVATSLAEAVRADPGDPEAHMALVAHHVRVADRPAALVAAQAAAAALPGNLGMQRMLGQIQLLAGDSQQAAATLKKLAASLPDDAALQVTLAEAFLATRDVDGARKALRRALEIDPLLGEAQRGLAMLALGDKRVDEALTIARDMQARDPKGALGYATEGDIEVQRKNWPQAAAAFRKALQHSQASEAAIKLHATLRAGGQVAEAQRVAADWDKQRPNDPAFRFYLGDVATNEKDYTQAEAHYRAVLAVQPGNGMAMNNVAWLLQKQGKPGALEMAMRANAALPNRAPVLDTLAAAQAAAGKLTDAIDSQQRAVAASPGDHELKLTLARYLIKAGQKGKARDQLEALRALGPKFARQPEVESALKTL